MAIVPNATVMMMGITLPAFRQRDRDRLGDKVLRGHCSYPYFKPELSHNVPPTPAVRHDGSPTEHGGLGVLFAVDQQAP